MSRWVGGFLVASIVAVPLWALEDKATSEKGEDRASQFKTVQKDYTKAIPDVREALEAAKTPEKRQAVFAKLNRDFAPRILKLVEADPKDKLSFEMLLWSCQALPDVDSRVFELLAKHWAKDAKIKDLCQMLSSDPPENAAKLLQKVLEDNPNKDIKGLACYELAQLANNRANQQGDAAAQADAEKLYERIRKDFADVDLQEETLGKKAQGALSDIHLLGIGKAAPNVKSEDLENKKVQLKDYKGKVVVLDIWATWCGPCKAMIPHEREMVEKLKDKPFALVSVSADDKIDDVKEFLKDTKMPWDHWWSGPEGGIVKDWKVRFFPTIYVLDAKGIIRYKHIRGKELEKAVERLLAEAKK